MSGHNVIINEVKRKVYKIIEKETSMRSRAIIFTKNGRKGGLKAVVRKYSQEMAGKRCFREVLQKYYVPSPIGAGFP